MQKAYLSSAFSDKSSTVANPTGFNADGQGLTDRTLPTLNELRAHLGATGRADITWEDVSDFRIRDANGQVKDFDAVTAGVQSIGSGEPLLLDMNPHFDGAIGTLPAATSRQAAVDTLECGGRASARCNSTRRRAS